MEHANHIVVWDGRNDGRGGDLLLATPHPRMDSPQRWHPNRPITREGVYAIVDGQPRPLRYFFERFGATPDLPRRETVGYRRQVDFFLSDLARTGRILRARLPSPPWTAQWMYWRT